MNSFSIFTGKISVFGGSEDSGMTKSEGLALYEHHEADKRPDLFYPRSNDLSLGTSQRLRSNDTLFFACRFPTGMLPRSILKETCWFFRNPENGKTANLWLVDWGPHEKTDRMFDLSPFATRVLEIKTDDIVEVYPFQMT